MINNSSMIPPPGASHVAPLPSRLAAKKAAFTLAEVLITLGIIGVVAALTLPTVEPMRINYCNFLNFYFT